jgi:hypothetical protein
MTHSAHRWRVIAGLGVLVVLLIVAGALLPPYVDNLKFQRYLDRAVERAHSPDILQTEILNRAAQMGLPVRAGDVRVHRTGNRLRVEIVYVVRVDLPLYTVDLHFHPAAGG